MITRGRWLYQTGLGEVPGSAWQLDGATEVPSGWWLRLRTGAAQELRWCGYCWTPPYRWWMIYIGPPSQWVLEPLAAWRWPSEHTDQHGYCTHSHRLADAMKKTEHAYALRIMRVLAGEK